MYTYVLSDSLPLVCLMYTKLMWDVKLNVLRSILGLVLILATCDKALYSTQSLTKTYLRNITSNK